MTRHPGWPGLRIALSRGQRCSCRGPPSTVVAIRGSPTDRLVALPVLAWNHGDRPLRQPWSVRSAQWRPRTWRGPQPSSTLTPSGVDGALAGQKASGTNTAILPAVWFISRLHDNGRLQRALAVVSKLVAMQDAAELVSDGAHIAFGGGGALMRRPLQFTRALIRRGARDLHVHNFLGGIEIDLLIGADAVASTNCAYVGLLEYGPAPNFQRAARGAELTVHEYSEFSIMAGLRAAELGLPFLPWRTLWGSDLVQSLGLKTIQDPYGGQKLLAVPATNLDIAVIQVTRADADGYVESADVPDLVWDYDYLISRVATTTIVCAEEVGPLRRPERVALAGREVTHVVEAPGGAWPAGIALRYQPDVEHVLSVYLPAAQQGSEAMQAYLEQYVWRGRR